MNAGRHSIMEDLTFSYKDKQPLEFCFERKSKPVLMYIECENQYIVITDNRLTNGNKIGTFRKSLIFYIWGKLQM